MLNPRENWLEAVRFGDPDYVPMGNEGIGWSFQFEGNFRREDWTDSWGVGWEVGLEGTVPFPKHNPLTGLERVVDFAFPDPADLVITDAHRDGLGEARREGKLLFGNLTYLLFERVWAITGMDNFLIGLIAQPEETKALLHGIADYARRVFDRYLDLGVDGIAFSEDLGTQRAPFISPHMFREFILPEYLHIFERTIAEGKIVLFHSCGCVTPIAEDLAGIPVALGGTVGQLVLNPIQHRANDLAVVKCASMGRMALNGAIDTAVLARGTVDDVRQEVAEVMEILKPGGGWICAPDQGIPGIPEENTDAMWEAARELGSYR